MPDGSLTRRRRGAPAAAIDMAPLECHLGFLLRIAQQRVFDEFHRCFADEGLTPARYSVLALLYANPDLQQGRLAEALRTKPSNLAVMLTRIEAQGLVERRLDQDNRRANLLRLTDLGRATYLRLTPAILAMEDRIARHLSSDERAVLLSALGRLDDDGPAQESA